MATTFHKLAEIDAGQVVALLNDPDVRRHMPLSSEHWTERSAQQWAQAKDAQWEANGYGPWAIRIDGEFVGWGGFQREGDEADLGLVLFPRHWGRGAAIFRALLDRGIAMGIGNLTILLPPSRQRLKGLARLGFEPAGELDYAGHHFLKFRLRNSQT